MSVLLQIREAHKRYGPQVLLDGASAAIAAGDKVGLIGRNGSGKSTLCRILLGDEELEAGEVVRSRSLRLGYLRQHDPFEPGESVLAFLIRDSGQPDWRCGQVAWNFGLSDAMLEGPVGELSGGWQTRVKLAALLLHDPNLLILDEPTNFLDLRTQIMLQAFLRDFRGACLVVSHDRTFLKATCTKTLELSRGKLTMFPGDVDLYIEQQDERRLHDERVNATVQTKRRQLETFINRNRAKASTASQARSKAKQLERLELTQIEGPESTAAVRVPQVEPRGGTAVRCKDLAIGYPDCRVADGIAVDVDHGERISVVGDNGEGKTTFLRTLAGSLSPLAGEVAWGHGCEVGVYAQHVYTSLPDTWTVHDYLRDRATADVGDQTVLNVAGSFLFRGDMLERGIDVLSGGERARLCLAGLLLGGHNILILDEPGNHLDIETVESLADAFCSYRGTIIFTSHDRHFMQRVATGVVEVRDGRVAAYPGDYPTYVYRVSKELQDGRRAEPGKAAPTDRRDRPATDRKEQNRRGREMRKAIAAAERKIAQLDKRRAELSEQLLSTTVAAEARSLHEEVTTLSEEITEQEHQWFELQEEAEDGE